MHVWGNKINIIQIIDHSLRLLAFVNRVKCWIEPHVCSLTGLPVLYYSDSFPRSATIRSHRSRTGIPSNFNLASKEVISDSVHCVQLKSVSYTSELLTQTCDFRKCIRFRQMLILSPQDLLQNRSLETVAIHFALLCFPHDNIVWNRSCDECEKSALPSVCHMRESILWLISQACWLPQNVNLSNSCQVQAFQDKIVSKLLTFSYWFEFALAWIDDHPGKGLKLCRNCYTFLFANSQYRSTHFWACPSMS